MEALELIVRRLREAPQHANMVLVAQADGPCYHTSSLVAMDTAIWQSYGQDEPPIQWRDDAEDASPRGRPRVGVPVHWYVSISIRL